jgi:hypothetical protein
MNELVKGFLLLLPLTFSGQVSVEQALEARVVVAGIPRAESLFKGGIGGPSTNRRDGPRIHLFPGIWHSGGPIGARFFGRRFNLLIYCVDNFV